MPCVYALHTKENPEDIRYVGITRYEEPGRRFKDHCKAASQGKSLPVQCWIRKNGADNITYSVLSMAATWEEACEKERATIKYLREAGANLLNRTDGGDGGLGMTHSKETKEKLSLMQKGKMFSEGTRKKLSEANKGKVLSEEHRNKIKKKILDANRKHTVEELRKMSDANKGRVITEGHRKKLSEANKGKPFTEERLKNIKEAQKNRRAKERQQKEDTL
jgi:hypothetical protein